MSEINETITPTTSRKPWNKGKMIGAKPPLRPKHVWSIRTKLQVDGRKRDLALFNLAIDSKLRGCDVVSVKVEDVAPRGYAVDRATVRQMKTGHPVKFELTEHTRQARDRAGTEASRRRREMRGKGAPKGATTSRAEEGSKLKLAVLAMAMRRLNGEVEQRRKMIAHLILIENAQKALAIKKESDEPRAASFNTRHAHQGMRNTPSRRRQNLIRPMELGRQRQAAKVAQAKRDSRQP